MSGYAMAHGSCCACGELFGFNPARVPSVRVNGVREPVCQACVNIANERRRAAGLEPIVPFPDAYEPCSEFELRDD